MPLRIESLRFRNFRNYESLDLDGLGKLTVFVGENAVGKTNIIEGIQLLTALTSFRHPKTEYLIREGEHTAYIEQKLMDDARELHLRLDIEKGHRSYLLNGKARRAADLKGVLPSVVFTPDDLFLVKGSHSARRSAVDTLGSQLSKNHYVVMKDYEKVLRHKNKLLKEESDRILIENINEMMITCGAQLAWYRSSLISKLGLYIQDAYKELSSGKETLEIAYIPSWITDQESAPDAHITFSRDEARENMRAALEASWQKEIDARRSIIGPHADKIMFYIQGRDASLFGSQGQQRSIVLAFKLAELFFIQDTIDQKPILLLDDVMSELDSARRDKFISFVEKGIQTFITTTHLEYFNKDFRQIIDPIFLPL